MTPRKAGLLGYMAQHLLAGVLAGILFGVLVLVTDLGHIRTLVMDSPDGIATAVLMFFGLMVTFGSVAMGVGIMNLARDDEDGDGGAP